MTNKNQIKQYLQDRLQGLESIKKEREWTTAELGDIACCKQTLAFIDSLQEEPVSNDLEEAATKYARKQLSNPDYPTYNDEYEMECAFEAGAQWQKEQMLKEDKL